jgi:protein-disulfide isomerase
MKAVGFIAALLVGGAIGYGVALKMPKKGGGSSVAISSNDALFELDGKTYTESDLPVDVQMTVFEGKKENTHRLEGVLQQYAMRLDLAKAAGRDKEVPLPDFESLLSVEKPKDEDLQKLYDANKDRLPPGTTFEQIKGDIEKYMTSQKMSEAMQTKAQEFKAAGKFKFLVGHPVAPRVEIDTAKMPVGGNKDAKNVVVEVADYLCPHCQMMHAEVEKLISEMGSEIRFHPVAFSLRPTGLSGTLARGAICAHKQGNDKFWAWHNSAFTTAKSKGWKVSDPDSMDPVKEIQASIQLDNAAFDTCINAEETKKELADLVNKMNALGVSATPTFFVNGRRMDIHGGSLKEELERQIKASSH